MMIDSNSREADRVEDKWRAWYERDATMEGWFKRSEVGVILAELARLRALAVQPAQEPVAWRYKWRADGGWYVTTCQPREGDTRIAAFEPLYPAPLPVQAGREELAEALTTAERFMAYWAGETENLYGGNGDTPETCLAAIRRARRLIGGPAHD